jgi:hypothetical protein
MSYGLSVFSSYACILETSTLYIPELYPLDHYWLILSSVIRLAVESSQQFPKNKIIKRHSL